jgi:quercetin dioxygenase-like cupin family protein
MDYTFLANLQTEFTLPEKGILSRVLHKDEHVNITLFGFSAGEALSAYSSPTPAVLYFLEGEAEVQLGDRHHLATHVFSGG